MGCNSESSEILAIDFATTLSEQFELDFLVYPNPCQNLLYFETNISYSNVYIKIYNSLGSLILSETSRGIASIDVSSFKPGVYFLKLEGNNRHTNFIKKFIKN
jgi:hypothetical protein